MVKASHRKFLEIARQFQLPGDFLDAAPCGKGHINDTFQVRFDQAGIIVRYIFQNLNTSVFQNPVGLMNNIVRVTGHIRRKLEEAGTAEISRRVLTLIPSRHGSYFYQEPDGHFWRVYLFVENTVTHEVIESPGQAEEVARIFGQFQEMLADLPGAPLVETIPGFHNARKRFIALQQAIEKDMYNRAAAVRSEIDFAMEREAIVDVLENLHKHGEIPVRITHNDTKINNVLFDQDTDRGLCVIDLDTVMPGLTLFDFGDMVRTAASTAGEDEQDLAKVRLSQPNFEALARGYWSTVEHLLWPAEKAHLVFAGKLITFVMGIRFLTDYLSGDTYYKIHRSTHNLDRCRTQFKLVESIEHQEETLNRFIERL